MLAPGAEIRPEDIPSEFGGASREQADPDWTQQLARWAERALADGETALLDRAVPEFERTMIRVALNHVRGRRQEAARLLGWGRNTLTRKIKELEMNGD